MSQLAIRSRDAFNGCGTIYKVSSIDRIDTLASRNGTLYCAISIESKLVYANLTMVARTI